MPILASGLALCNIVRVKIETEETQAKTHVIDTAQSASVEPALSEGVDEELRVKNRILAQNRTEDILKGCDIKLTDVLWTPEVFSLIDGGTATYVTSPAGEGQKVGDFLSYAAPVAGAVANRTRFTLTVYTQENDIDGDPKGYLAVSFPNCKGSPVASSFEDGTFMASEYTIKSRPKTGQSPYSYTRMKDLPAIS